MKIKLSRKKQTILAIMFLDLDKFKEVNDNFGHCTGDKLLWQVAKRVKNTISSKDLIARFGGDEFTILIRDIAYEKQVEDLARDIIEVLENYIYRRNICKYKDQYRYKFFPKRWCCITGTNKESR